MTGDRDEQVAVRRRRELRARAIRFEAPGKGRGGRGEHAPEVGIQIAQAIHVVEIAIAVAPSEGYVATGIDRRVARGGCEGIGAEGHG